MCSATKNIEGLAFGVLLSLACVCPAYSDDAAFCLLLNRVAAEDKLGEYSADQIQVAICLASNATRLAVAAHDVTAEQICMQSKSYLTKEFTRRFPDRDPKRMMDRC